MIKKIEYLFIYLILLLPITLITGPAIPDLTIFFTGIYFIILFLITKKYKEIVRTQIVYISIIFWIYLLFVTLFAENQYLAFRDSLIFIRILLIPIFIFYWILSNETNLKKLSIVVFFVVIFVCFDCVFQFLNYNPEYGFGEDLFGFKPDFYGRLTGPFKDELIPGAFVSKFSFDAKSTTLIDRLPILSS